LWQRLAVCGDVGSQGARGLLLNAASCTTSGTRVDHKDLQDYNSKSASLQTTT
ncbi:unnamed protein product, partial [Amoebophrya sp. A25]